ncbi:MAG: PKD domain-containing protein, partial [Parcubacteria group bacterium]|nr:PKD domain-containing protein [Parcubacteria group bacterium]
MNIRFFYFILPILFCFVFLGSFAFAGPSQNVTGFAWSENIGWISHNSSDTGGAVDYGVNIEADGRLAGYAWSENYGWIQYDPVGPYPSAPNYSAKYFPCTGKIRGWAKILSLGDSGWISLSAPAGAAINYGVTIDSATKKFKGYAWSDWLGWIQYDPVFGGVVTSANVPCVTSHNVYDFAWADTIGWISHNKEDADSMIDYGVNMESDGRLTGYGWSDNIGWIQYDPAGPYPAAPAYAAQYDPCTGKVSGWAKIAALGDDGWLSLFSSGGIAYGVTMDANGRFHGYSWNNEIGWTQYDPSYGGVYAVNLNFASAPKTAKLIKPVGDKETWFDYPEFRNEPLLPSLSWTDYESQSCAPGLTQQSYTAQISALSDFSVLLYEASVDSAGSAHAISIPSPLNYNQSYYWRVKVKDNLGQESAWGTVGVLGEINRFRTPLHQAPTADFSTVPPIGSISAGSEVQFFDKSAAYGGSSIVYWKWDFGDGTIIEGGNPAVHKNPKHTYDTEGNRTIVLLARDSDGYEGTKTV